MDILSGEISTMIFERVVKHDIGDFSLDSQMLSVVTELDGKKNLDEIAKKTGLSMGELREVLSKLLNLDLIMPIEEVASEVDEAFFAYLKEQLSLAVGPIAEIIIEEEIADLGFPLYCRGISAITTKLLGYGGEINTVVQCGGVTVHPGDLIVADGNGILVLRPDEARRVADEALERQEREKKLIEKLREGKLLPELTKANALIAGKGVE